MAIIILKNYLQDQIKRNDLLKSKPHPSNFFASMKKLEINVRLTETKKHPLDLRIFHAVDKISTYPINRLHLKIALLSDR